MSQTLGFTVATRRIAETFRRLQEEQQETSRAYFFMIGAGVSAPEVKLAADIEQECRTAVDGEDADVPVDQQSPMGRYSYWLRSAHPNRVQRQEYFRGLIEKHAISAANFRLAHLIVKGPVPRLVVTANFDDFLARALSLFDTPPIVSDHPATAERIDPERSDDIQILHLHGTYWFYDCCNLTGEISARAEPGLVHQTVASRLDQILYRRSPIVLGYSGWEEDVFMTSLKRRLDAGGLPYELFWFCHHPGAVDALPDFLRDHADVCLVVPDPPTPGRDAETKPEPNIEGGTQDNVPEPGSTSREHAPRLDAVTVLDRLIRELGLDEPELTRNPIGFYADHLSASLPLSEAADVDGRIADVYRLRSMIDKLNSMRDLWTVSDEPAGHEPVLAARLDPVQTAIRRSQYREAIEAAHALALEELDPGQLAELRGTMMLAALQLVDDLDEEIAAYDIVVRANDLIVAHDAQSDSAEDVANALLSKASALARLKRRDEALAIYDELIARYEGTPQLELQKHVADARLFKALRLAELGRNEEALAIYDEFIDGHAGDPVLRHHVARALASKGFRLGSVGRHDEAVSVYERLIADYGEDAASQRQVVVAKFNMAWELGELGRHEEGLAAYDTLIAQYGGDDAFRVQVARSLFNKARMLERQARPDDAFAAYDELIARYDDDTNVRIEVASARTAIGSMLASLGRVEEAIAAYDGLIARYEDDPKLTTLVAGAIEKRAEISP